MVLIVIPNVVRQDVKGSVVRVRFLWEAVPEVVLCDEVPGGGVQGPSEERGEEEVHEGPRTKGSDEEIIEDYLYPDIDKVPYRRRLRTDKAGTKCVEKYLERAKEDVGQGDM